MQKDQGMDITMTRSGLDATRARITGDAPIPVAELRQIALALLVEVERDRAREHLLRADYVELLEAARAAVAAVHHHGFDPTAYLEGELGRRGLLPPPDMTPQQALADAASLRRLLCTAA
jgi:hypothetical protein